MRVMIGEVQVEFPTQFSLGDLPRICTGLEVRGVRLSTAGRKVRNLKPGRIQRGRDREIAKLAGWQDDYTDEGVVTMLNRLVKGRVQMV